MVFGDENSRVDNAELNRIYSAYLEARGGLANLVQVKSMTYDRPRRKSRTYDSIRVA